MRSRNPEKVDLQWTWRLFTMSFNHLLLKILLWGIHNSICNYFENDWGDTTASFAISLYVIPLYCVSLLMCILGKQYDAFHFPLSTEQLCAYSGILWESTMSAIYNLHISMEIPNSIRDTISQQLSKACGSRLSCWPRLYSNLSASTDWKIPPISRLLTSSDMHITGLYGYPFHHL